MILRVFRYDPGARERMHEYEVETGPATTVLDALVEIQRTLDPTLAFRYACRVGMCGSCAMVVNGRERWTCRTRLATLGGGPVTVRPLYHFPLIKDLVVDMAPFAEKMKAAGAAFVPRESEAGFPPIGSGSRERARIDPAIECIGCGACLSACTMVGWDANFLGPAALTRAFTAAADSRDGGLGARWEALFGEDGVFRCHGQQTCIEVCPMGLEPSEAIRRLRRMGLGAIFSFAVMAF